MLNRFLKIFACSSIAFSLSAHCDTFNVGLLKSGHPPFSFPASHHQKGIYVDILQQITLITGDKFIINYYPNKRLIKSFNDGLIHIEPGVSPLWRTQWKDISRYSIAFTQYTDVTVFRKNELFKINSAADLMDKGVATVKSYYYPGFQNAFNSGKIKRYSLNHELQLLKFLSKKQRGADVGFINEYVLMYYIKKEGFSFDIGNSIGNVPIMFRFHVDNSSSINRFNKALETLINNGSVSAIIEKYKR